MRTSSQTLRFIEQLYDDAEAGRDLDATFGELGAALDAPGVHSLLLDGGSLVEAHRHGGSPAAFLTFETHWMHQDPRLAAMMTREGGVVRDEEILDRATFERSQYFNEALRPVGVRFSLLAKVPIAPGLVLAQAYMRPPGTRAFTEREATYLTDVIPHVRRAMHLRQTVRKLHTQLADLERALDVLPMPLAVVDAKGHLVCANATASALFDRGDGLRRSGAGISATTPADVARLAGLIAQVADEAEGAQGALSRRPLGPLRLSRAERSPLGVHALPLRPNSPLRDEGHSSARVLLVFHDPQAVASFDRVQLMMRHGLTLTESLLAVAIGQGKTLADFAAERGSTEETARTHLKRVLAKTGTRRQADLVRLLLSDLGLQFERPS